MHADAYIGKTPLRLLAVLLLAVCGPLGAAEGEAPEYSGKGADTCLKCHDEDNEYPVLPI